MLCGLARATVRDDRSGPPKVAVFIAERMTAQG